MEGGRGGREEEGREEIREGRGEREGDVNTDFTRFGQNIALGPPSIAPHGTLDGPPSSHSHVTLQSDPSHLNSGSSPQDTNIFGSLLHTAHLMAVR